ncbi:MarP family serine protease [Leucobacter musarum]|uniref:MarP family serine protease n=1 Tax=Leucobacter musarum TaxID=1930747 RepID=UPI0006A779C7|nr:MarP family serine protease [Leucobacter musarum]
MLPIADIIMLVVLIAATISGFRSGFFSVLGALAGLVVGAALSPWLLPIIAREIPENAWRSAAVVGSAVLLLAVGAGLGSLVGSWFRRGADRLKLRFAERLLGGALGLVASVVAVSLIGAGIASSGVPVVSSAVASSSVLRTLQQWTPAPLTDAAARLQAAVLDDTVIPTVDALLDGDLGVSPDVAAIDTDDPALAQAAQSVARISGVAYGCSTMPTGTGFVVAEDRVVTNAHVVAGVDTPLVELPGEPARDGQVVYFDPIDDLAVIAVDVDAAPLPIDDTLVPGSAGAVEGYPYGGPFTTVAAGVLATRDAPIADIYNSSTSPRSIHVLSANVRPGNSGGPLLTAEGGVAGVVFARDTQRENVGYAMTVAELLPVLATLDSATSPVSTGACIPG